MAEKKRYTKPPIDERIIGVYREIPKDVFEAKLPTWIEKIKPHYPIPAPFAEWFLDVVEKDGVPFIENIQPQAKIIYLFWKRHPKNLKVLGMRLRPDRLVFHLAREEDNAHDFDELYPEIEKWILPWAEHFHVESVTGVTVEYVNRLNYRTTPQFVTPTGNIKLSEALHIFSKIPGRHKSITKPFDCKVRLKFDEPLPCVFDVKVIGEEESRNGVRVDFIANTNQNGKEISLIKALEEIKQGHDLILEEFDCLFTERAKESFARNEK